MNKVGAVAFVLFAGCTLAGDRGNEDLKSGEVTQLAFTADGNNLVLVNEFLFLHYPREKSHSRVRNFSTSDWKTIADTKELAMIRLMIAPSDKQSWIVQGMHFDRFGLGNPLRRPVYFDLDLRTMEQKKIDVIQGGARDIGDLPAVVTCAREGTLCVFAVSISGEALRPPLRI